MYLNPAALLPAATAWAEGQAALALTAGTPVDTVGVAAARAVGVQHPEKVRLVVVDRIPWPDDPALRDAALQTELLGPRMAGLTLDHAVFIRRGREHDLRLLRHELRHVQQVESAGSVGAFLAEYLVQLVTVGYENAPLELDARAHELGRA